MDLYLPSPAVRRLKRAAEIDALEHERLARRTAEQQRDAALRRVEQLERDLQESWRFTRLVMQRPLRR